MLDLIRAFPGVDSIMKQFETASRMRVWINDHKNELVERIKKDVEKEQVSETEKEEKIDKIFSEEL
jgi:predicted transcriptional regulator